MPGFLPIVAAHQIISFVSEVLTWVILAFPILSVYVTVVHWRWWRLYRPSALIRHLLISSMAVDVSSIIVAFLAAIGLGLIPVKLPEGAATILVGVALVIALGVKVYRRFSLRSLDEPDVDIEQRVETQDQREDRQFGEQRRELEDTHLEENGLADQG